MTTAHHYLMNLNYNNDVKDINPAKIIPSCLIFLVILFYTGSLDLSFALAFIPVIILFSVSSLIVLILSFLLFLLHLGTIFLKLKLDFIFDLSISSYIIFAVGLVQYYREGQKSIWEFHLSTRKIYSVKRDALLKFGLVLVVTTLIYPLVDGYTAAIVGYFIFSILFRTSDGRFAFALGLLFLIFCPFLLIFKMEKTAEISAIFTYYFLVIGVVQEIYNMFRHPSEYLEEDLKDIKIRENVTNRLILRSEKIRKLKNILPEFNTDLSGYIKIKVN